MSETWAHCSLLQREADMWGGVEGNMTKCEVGAELKCSNCDGAHSVVFGGCEVRKRAKEIQLTTCL